MQKNQELMVKRSLQKALIIRSFDDIIQNKAEKTKSIVIDNGKENETWVYLSKEKSKILPKSSATINISMLADVSGMSNNHNNEDTSSEDESLDLEDESFELETSDDSVIAVSSEETLFHGC